MGSAGIIGWPDSVSGNVLNSLPLDNPFVQVLAAGDVCGAYAQRSTAACCGRGVKTPVPSWVRACLVVVVVVGLPQVAQGLIGIVVLGHYPLNHHPARGGLHDICHLLGVTDPPDIFTDMFTLIFVASSVGEASRARDALGAPFTSRGQGRGNAGGAFPPLLVQACRCW